MHCVNVDLYILAEGDREPPPSGIATCGKIYSRSPKLSEFAASARSKRTKRTRRMKSPIAISRTTYVLHVGF
ncbi:hypothetical protein L484_023271 [Morus notabilis]|uniref:Uncharacterized protein n=1 Tax=Morus notabilis TaxID=981085 RepID=W9SCR7_9ROSA|nr:hypothetical protein L484_023271 [Morus notabilis]